MGKKTLANRGIDGNGEIGEYDRRWEELNQGRRCQLADVRRSLEDAIGVAGNRGARNAAAMVISIRALMRLLI